MPLVVQKFGGTSVADSQKILGAARKAIRAHREGNQVVVVVSAMGKNTDLLIDLANEINETPPAREMDMLLSTGEQVSVALMAMAVDSLGYRAVSLTGAQIGIRTDSIHTKARIKSISTERIKRLLDEGNIVIAAGFQGIDEDLNITTLGRGGSDTTAVALAAVLNADQCEIYTDVDGVYTTDPRILPEARLVKQVSYDEMLELASLGAGVMHSRSIEFAKKFNTAIRVRSSLSDGEGTLIVAEPEAPGLAVSGAAQTKNEARVSILGVPDRPGVSFEIFSRIADRKITVDMIVQNIGDHGIADISFTVPREELKQTYKAVQEAVTAIGGGTINSDENVSKISAVGLGMAKQSGVANKMFRALSDAGINLQMITTSEIKISVLVSRTNALSALRIVHEVYELDKKPNTKSLSASRQPANRADAVDVISRLHGIMEDLTIDAITLDESQARVTIAGVPNRPGIAAAVFEAIAERNIFVDMIVQSYGADERADMTWTIPKASHDEAVRVAKELLGALDCKSVSSSQDIAKLSVSGIGLRSHTGVAIGMFKALADAGINVMIISTSEVRVNVVVEGKDGKRALDCLQKQFQESMR
jgi:aspartate kinase